MNEYIYIYIILFICNYTYLHGTNTYLHGTLFLRTINVKNLKKTEHFFYYLDNERGEDMIEKFGGEKNCFIVFWFNC